MVEVIKEPDTGWFGIVRWSDEDIATRLQDFGFDAGAENISIIRRNCEHHFFTDSMIETGWNCIDSYINENRKILKEEIDND